MNAPKFSQVSCSQCGRTFGPGDHGYSHCDNHREWDSAPVMVMDEMQKQKAMTTLDYLAEYQPEIAETRDDPGEPASYEVRRMRLHMTDDMRAFITDCCAIRFECGKPVFMSMNPDEVRTAHVIEIDDPDLAEELSDYLMSAA